MSPPIFEQGHLSNYRLNQHARHLSGGAEEIYKTIEDSDLLGCDAASRWVNGSRRFEGTWCLHHQASSGPFERPETIHPRRSVTSKKIGILNYTVSKTSKLTHEKVT
jgi:hypothetical protein